MLKLKGWMITLFFLLWVSSLWAEDPGNIWGLEFGYQGDYLAAVDKSSSNLSDHGILLSPAFGLAYHVDGIVGELDMSLLFTALTSVMLSENALTPEFGKSNDSLHVSTGHVFRLYAPYPLDDDWLWMFDFDLGGIMSTHYSGRGPWDTDPVRRLGASYLGLGTGLGKVLELGENSIQATVGYTWMYHNNTASGDLTGGHAIVSTLDSFFALNDSGLSLRTHLGYDYRYFYPVHEKGAGRSSVVNDINLRISLIYPFSD